MNTFVEKFKTANPTLHDLFNVWIPPNNLDILNLRVDNVYVPIGECAVADIMLSHHKDRDSYIYGINIYHERGDLIPEEWFCKNWLYFVTEVMEKGYITYCGKDIFFKSKEQYVKGLHCFCFRMVIWKES